MFVSHITYVYMYVCIFRSVYLLVLLEENNIIQPWDLIWESHLLISTFINFFNPFFYAPGTKEFMKNKNKEKR